MDELVGRTLQFNRMSEYIESDKAEFLVLFGRRRVGKTYLVKYFFRNKFDFFMSGAENATKEEQLHNFYLALNEYSNVPYPKVENWQDAFMQLKHFCQNKQKKGKIVIFLDELPWLDNDKSGFLSAFEYFWNTYASTDNRIFLVACGSATSWMLENILNNRGGLHNRVTRQIHLQPFTLAETEQFLKYKKIVLDRYQIVECYMIMGGIPYYLEQMEKQYSLSQNIDNLFFANDGVLRKEFDRLYSSLFNKPGKYIEIIKVLAKKRKGLLREEIVKEAKITDGGGLSTILNDLEACGFIVIDKNFTTPKRNRIYKLVDFYSLFYLNFVNSAINDAHFWTNSLNTPAHNAWAGFSFELLCSTHIVQIKQKLGISGVITDISSWRSREAINRTQEKGAQIDLLIDRADNLINLCEMKFSKTKYTITSSYDKVLKNKLAVFAEETKTRKAIHLTMLTTYGVERNEYWGNIQSEITMDDLFLNV